MKLPVILILLFINPFKSTEAFYPFKLIHNASHEISLSPEEWASEFQCDTGFLANETVKTTPVQCYRDKNAWIYKHVDELQGEFKLLVHQQSIDARFADSVYLTNGHTGLDFHHYKFNSGDTKQDELNLHLVAGPEVNNDACRRHLKQMVDLVADLGSRVDQMRRHNDTGDRLTEAHFRLARVLDSFGRYESGQLGGRYHSFGIYDQCIGTSLLLADEANQNQVVGSRYCWARLNLDRHLSRPLQDASRDRTSGSSIVSHFPGDFKFHMAVCLPKSCHSAAFVNDEYRENRRLVQQLIDSQFKMPKSMYLDESLPLESVFCLVDETSQVARMSLGGKLFIAFVLVWILLCMIATYRRRYKHQLILDNLIISELGQQTNKRKSLLSHLDLFESWFEFLGERELSRQGNRVNLDPLNFVKWFCTLLVVMCHATVLSGPLTLAHIKLAAIMETQRFESLSLFGFVLVDSFFVITGMMMTYIFLKKVTALERHETDKLNDQLAPTNLSKPRSKVLDFEQEYSPLGRGFYKACTALTLSRYLRLVPLFFMAFWFKKTVYPYMGSGPMWDYGLNKNTTIGGCLKETWLTPFTFLSAYLSGATQCLPQTWTISNDLYFALVMPPTIVLFYKWPRSALSSAILSLVVSLYWGQLVYYQLDARARFEIEQLRDHSVVILFQMASYIYTMPLYRMPAILVGTVTGYVLFKYSQSGQINKSKSRPMLTENERHETVRRYRWPWWFRGPITYLCLILVVLIFISSLFTPEFRRYASDETKRSMVLYMMLYYHFIWSLANAVLFLRLVTDLNNHFVFRMFASRFFSTAGKLSYAILLIHWDLLMFDLHIETQALEFSRWNYFGAMSMAYLVSIPVAIVVFVVFENPIDKLTKTYLLPQM